MSDSSSGKMLNEMKAVNCTNGNDKNPKKLLLLQEIEMVSRLGMSKRIFAAYLRNY